MGAPIENEARNTPVVQRVLRSCPTPGFSTEAGSESFQLEEAWRGWAVTIASRALVGTGRPASAAEIG
ncbi:hypothetical protein BDN67DRAFT_963081 [Paxillus ammoniavirescens]|nr:hypothetical protein BDN67DRAFT_963081 [Paxillus ammoniavirescens]